MKGIFGISVIRIFYNASNYISDENAMNNLNAGSDELEEIAEEDAVGEKSPKKKRLIWKNKEKCF